MKTMKTRISAAALHLGLALLTARGAFAADGAADDAAKKLNALFPDAVVARGKGFEVKRSQVEEAFTALRASASAQGQKIPEGQRSSIESNLVDRIVVTKLLVARAKPEELRLANAKTDSNLAQLRTNAPTQEVFENQIKASGMSLDQLRARMSEQLACEAVLERELKPGIKVTDADVHKFYEENPAKFEQPEMVRASHILIGTLDPATQQPLPPDKKKEKEDAIKQARARAVAGEDFAKLARELSEDPGSKSTGGEYTFPRGRMVPEFEAAAFSLRPNQISDVVETKYGYHIIKLSEKIPAKKVEFEKVSEKIKDFLMGREMQKLLPAFTEKMKKEADVQVLGMASTVAPAK